MTGSDSSDDDDENDVSVSDLKINIISNCRDS